MQSQPRARFPGAASPMAAQLALVACSKHVEHCSSLVSTCHQQQTTTIYQQQHTTQAQQLESQHYFQQAKPNCLGGNAKATHSHHHHHNHQCAQHNLTSNDYRHLRAGAGDNQVRKHSTSNSSNSRLKQQITNYVIQQQHSQTTGRIGGACSPMASSPEMMLVDEQQQSGNFASGQGSALLRPRVNSISTAIGAGRERTPTSSDQLAPSALTHSSSFSCCANILHHVAASRQKLQNHVFDASNSNSSNNNKTRDLSRVHTEETDQHIERHVASDSEATGLQHYGGDFYGQQQLAGLGPIQQPPPPPPSSSLSSASSYVGSPQPPSHYTNQVHSPRAICGSANGETISPPASATNNNSTSHLNQPYQRAGVSAMYSQSSGSSSTGSDHSMNIINLEQYISKRNERERSRVRNVNDAFDNLKNSLPLETEKLSKRMSKVEILRTAIGYIRNLEDVLGCKEQQQQNSVGVTLRAQARNHQQHQHPNISLSSERLSLSRNFHRLDGHQHRKHYMEDEGGDLSQAHQQQYYSNNHKHEADMLREFESPSKMVRLSDDDQNHCGQVARLSRMFATSEGQQQQQATNIRSYFAKGEFDLF